MKRELTALLVVALLLVVAWLGYRYAFDDPADTTIALVEVRGPVTRQGPSGAVREAAAGDTLAVNERLASGEGGRAVLAVGTGSELVLDAASSLRVLEVAEAGVRVELEDGRVRATVRPGGPALGVRAGENEARASDGVFTVARGGDGTVAVRDEAGTVSVRGRGEAIDLFAGQDAVLPAGRQALVQPASAALLLEVTPHGGGRTAAPQVEVRGTSEPGARITVKGRGAPVQVVAAADGSWIARVDLGEGENAVEVKARSLLGREAAATWRVTRDTEAPAISVEIRP